MPKYKTLKEIHRFLIKNNLLHRERHYDIEDQKLLNDFIEENNNEFCPVLLRARNILLKSPIWRILMNFNEFNCNKLIFNKF